MAPNFWTKQSQTHYRWIDTTLARCLIGTITSKQNMETDPGAAEVTTSLIFVCTPPQPSAGPWHRLTAGDEGFLRLGPHFRGQYSPGCSEKHSGAVSINPISACSSISQLVLLFLVNKPSPAPNPKSASSMAPYRNGNSPWQVSCLGLPVLSEPELR